MDDLAREFPKRKRNSHKGTYGKVLLIAGSRGMSGAAYLSAKAAYAVGAGLVQIYTTEDNRVILQQLLPEAIVSTYRTFEKVKLDELLEWADVVEIGCGLGKSETSRQLVSHTLHCSKIPCVVDADGLNLLAENMEWLTETKAKLVLTPHMKEMTRLLHCDMNELLAARFQKLREFTEQFRQVTVLKDSRTLVASKDENFYLNLSGNASMAKGGAGDVLAGVITGLMAQNMQCCKAAFLGVYLHGLAGDAARARRGITVF